MCIPSQITCNCYSKVFNAFNVFKVSSLQGIWSMDLIDPFPCQLHHIAFDRLKSHTPLPCPGTQSINIPLKFQCVFFILNFTIANTVIKNKTCEHARYEISLRLKSFEHLSCTERQKKRPQDIHLYVKACFYLVVWIIILCYSDRMSTYLLPCPQKQ